jgi:ribosomal protein L37AE/L43A
MDDVSAEFVCKCGNQKAWIRDGQEIWIPCPHCGRTYTGKYNPKTLTIDAIERKK